MDQFSATIMIVVPGLTPSPNRMLRMHWSARRRYVNDLAWQVRAALRRPLPTSPMPRARVTIWRHAIQSLDVDALAASAKYLLDVLQPASRRHPYGLGIIANDRPGDCELIVRHVPARHRAEERMVVEAVPLAADGGSVAR